MGVVGGYQERVDRTSPLGTAAGFAFETAKWSTWRNPFFTARIGRAGWDPEGGGVMGWLDKKSGGMVNKLLGSDEAVDLYAVQSRASKAGHNAFKLAYAEWSPGNSPILNDMAKKYAAEAGVAMKHVEYAGTAASMDISTDALKAAVSSKRAAKGSVLLAGERFHNPLEKLAKSAVDRRMASATAEGAGRFASFGAAKYTVGKALTGMNWALMAYDLGKGAMAGFNFVAEAGTQSRMRPYMTMGSGVQDTYMAQTLRQTALASMYSSEMGPRRMMGNEASFLHS
jgi:hypothetical protein